MSAVLFQSHLLAIAFKQIRVSSHCFFPTNKFHQANQLLCRQYPVLLGQTLTKLCIVQGVPKVRSSNFMPYITFDQNFIFT